MQLRSLRHTARSLSSESKVRTPHDTPSDALLQTMHDRTPAPPHVTSSLSCLLLNSVWWSWPSMRSSILPMGHAMGRHRNMSSRIRGARW